MSGFDEVLKSVQLQQKIQKSLGVSSQLSEMFKERERMTKSFSGLSMANEILKIAERHNSMFKTPSMSAIEAIRKDMSFKSKFEIPQTAFDAIKAINRRHEELFGGIGAMVDALNIKSPAVTQINSLNVALNGISGQIAAIAAQRKNWKIIEEFDEVTEQVAEFSEGLTEEITEEQEKQFQILLALIFAFIKKHKQKGINVFRFLEVVLVFYGYYSIFTPKPDLATKEDIKQINYKQDTLVHYIKLVNEQLREAKEYRVTDVACDVKLKPKLKTLTLTKLPRGFEVITIQVHHKWVYVSYFDPNDNLPQTGWILKKYLNRPK